MRSEPARASQKVAVARSRLVDGEDDGTHLVVDVGHRVAEIGDSIQEERPQSAVEGVAERAPFRTADAVADDRNVVDRARRRGDGPPATTIKHLSQDREVGHRLRDQQILSRRRVACADRTSEADRLRSIDRFGGIDGKVPRPRVRNIHRVLRGADDRPSIMVARTKNCRGRGTEQENGRREGMWCRQTKCSYLSNPTTRGRSATRSGPDARSCCGW